MPEGEVRTAQLAFAALVAMLAHELTRLGILGLGDWRCGFIVGAVFVGALWAWEESS